MEEEEEDKHNKMKTVLGDGHGTSWDLDKPDADIKTLLPVLVTEELKGATFAIRSERYPFSSGSGIEQPKEVIFIINSEG